MTALRMAFTELHRLTSSRLRRLAVIAMILVPTLYGGLYLYANRDPYANLKNLPAALVVQDAGARMPDGAAVNAGEELADRLVSSRSFAWSRVDPGRAAEGVRDGSFAFALSVPRDFSAALMSSERLDPRQAQLTMTTNDANSYISTTIADNVADEVRDTLAEQVGTDAATSFLLGISQERAALLQAADGTARVAGGIDTAATGARQFAAGAERLEAGSARLRAGATQLSAGLTLLENQTTRLPAQSRALAEGARQVADGNDRVARTGKAVAAAATDLVQHYDHGRETLKATLANLDLTDEQRRRVLAAYDSAAPTIDGAVSQVRDASASLNRLATGADRVAQGTAALAESTPRLVQGIARARDGAERLERGVGEAARGSAGLSDGAKQLTTGLDRLSTGSARLREGMQSGLTKLPDLDEQDRASLAATIGDPVAIESTSHGTRSYGAGLAPFFLALATWIGGYVLFLFARPLSRRALAANQAPWRVALAGWLTPVLVGLLQVSLLYAIVLAGLDIVPAQPLATLGFLMLTSATFMAIVHWLNAWLGAVGQFLGLVLMVVQLVSAGGTFPWQTIPEPLQWVHRVLPMSYAVDGLRQLMYGGLGSLVVRDALVLAVYLSVAVVLTTLVARRQRVWSVKRIKPELVI